jgi:hypothetical protein
MKIVGKGTGDLGMTVQDVRDWVEKTAHVPGTEYVDCHVPSAYKSGDVQMAALMGLITFDGKKDK